MDGHVLPDFRGIDVHMNDGGRGRKGGDVHRHPVVEARAESDQEIAFGDGVVGVARAVQAEHAQEERMIAGEAGESLEGVGHGGGDRFGELQEFLRSARGEYAAARVNHRAFGFSDDLGDFLDSRRMSPERRLIAPQVDFRRIGEFNLLLQDILGDVHQDGSGSARVRRDVKRVLDDRGELGRVLHEVIVLGDRGW